MAGSACRTVKAATPVERPALEVPPPPPRVIAPIQSENELPVLEPISQLPPNPAERNTSKPRPRPRPEQQVTQDPKPGEQVEAPAPVQQPPAQPQQPTSPLRLENPNSGQMVAQIRDSIGRAKGMLSQVTRARLPNEQRKKAYDDAQLFVEQAEDALKQNNLVAAKELADKAERLAKELQG